MTRTANVHLPLAISIVCLLAGAAAAVPPPNDLCGAATVIAALPFTGTADTTMATVGGADPAHSCTGVYGNSVWYSYTAPGGSPTTLDIDTAGSAYAATIAVYDNACPPTTEHGCFFDATLGDTRLPVSVPGGSTVLIQISDTALAGGLMTVTVSESPYHVAETRSLLTVTRSDAPSPLGGVVGRLERPTALSKRHVAFAGETQGLFRQVGGVLGTIAVSGDPTPVGGTFRTFGPPAVMNANTGAFFATIDGVPGVTSGIFRFNGGAIAPVAVDGGAAPIAGNWTGFRPVVAMNLAGDLAFIGKANAVPRIAVYLAGGGGGLGIPAREGDPNPCGGTFDDFGRHGGGLAINLGGDVAFSARGSLGDESLFLRAAGVTSAVACDGGAAPVLGGTYRSLGTEIELNDAADVVFQATVDTGISRVDTVYVGPLGGLSPAATTGDVAAGGEVVGSIPASIKPALSNSGLAAFHLRLLPPDGSGIAVYPVGGALEILHKEGGACPIGGSFDGFGDAVTVNVIDDVDFDATCTAGQGVLQGAVAAAASVVSVHTDPTAIGPGFVFDAAYVEPVGDSVFRGKRTAVYTNVCGGAGCVGPLVLASALQPWPVGVGNSVESIDSTAVGGYRRSVVRLETSGAMRTSAIALALPAGLRKVVETGDAVPGGGTFAGFDGFDPFDPEYEIWRPAGFGAKVAFTATVSGAAATQGIFLKRSAAVATIADDTTPSPDGGTFTVFSRPALSGSKVAFAAETTAGECVFHRRSPTAAIDRVGCVGDAMPAAIGGTIDEILAPPAVDGRLVSFLVRASGGSADECTLVWDGAVVTATVCEGDPQPGGGTFGGATFNDVVTTIQAAKKTTTFLGADTASNQSVYAYRKGALIRVASDGASAPAGGTFSLLEGTSPTTAGKAVVFKSDLNLGPAGEAIFIATLR